MKGNARLLTLKVIILKQRDLKGYLFKKTKVF